MSAAAAAADDDDEKCQLTKLTKIQPNCMVQKRERGRRKKGGGGQ